MKIAVFTDIHGNLEALNAILEDIKNQEVNEIICLGDTIGIGPNPKECIDTLMENNVSMILGNHELYAVNGIDKYPKTKIEEIPHHEWVKSELTEKEFDYIKKCPLYYTCDIKFENKLFNQQIIFSHYLLASEDKINPFENNNLKEDINLWIKYNDENKTYIVGHLHKSFNENEVEGISGDYIEELGELTNITVLDSAGCTTTDETSYMLIEIGKTRSFSLKKVKFDRNKFIEQLNKIDYPDKQNIMKKFYGIE